MATLEWENPPEMKIDLAKKYRATIEADKGKIEIDLYPGECTENGGQPCLPSEGRLL